MICGYQDRTFFINSAQSLEIEFRDKEGKVYNLAGYDFSTDNFLEITNIQNDEKYVPYLISANVDVPNGKVSIAFEIKNLSERFLKTNEEKNEKYGRGNLCYAYKVKLTTGLPHNPRGWVVLRGLARLVK